MRGLRRLSLAGVGAALLWAAANAFGQIKEDATVRASIAVLQEAMTAPLRGIPRSMLVDAQGIAIIPDVIKGGFIVGARFGRGVLLVRDDRGNWQAPVFITLTGGNVGWQAGVQATDVILVFKTRKSVQGILNGKFTLGADAAAAAGPVGRQAGAGTDLQLKAEIYTYSRSRGLFAGVSIDGSVIAMDAMANASYYRRPAPNQPPVVPPAAIQLVQVVGWYCGAGPPPVASASFQEPVSAEPGGSTDPDALRNQLAGIAPQLYELLDDQWKEYLALPAEIFSGKGHPPVESLSVPLAHFEAVRRDARYRALTERREFQTAYGLLEHYAAVLNRKPGKLHLPPPPGSESSKP